jgi:hypothetical protein
VGFNKTNQKSSQTRVEHTIRQGRQGFEDIQSDKETLRVDRV